MRNGIVQLHWAHLMNAYLIDTPAGPVLVDCWGPGLLRSLCRQLKQWKLDLKDIAGVVLTHCHVDHAGLAFRLAEAGIPIYAAEAEVPILSGSQAHPGYGPGAAGKLLRDLERAFLPAIRLAGVNGLAQHAQIFSSQWQVVLTPGHSPGSLALFHVGTGDLISGDTLISDFGRPTGPQPLFTPDYPLAIRSAYGLLELDPRTIHPGHGRSLPKSAYDRFHERLKKQAVGWGGTPPS